MDVGYLNGIFIVLLSLFTLDLVCGATDCEPYAYCDGKSFPSKVMLGARIVTCDTAPAPKYRCCLPQSKHFVCYGIKVDGVNLNYDANKSTDTTDFTGLCSAMANTEKKETGKHSSAIIGKGGGHLIWRYGEWTSVAGSEHHIKNLACEIKN